MDFSNMIWIVVILTTVLIIPFLPSYSLTAVFRSAKSAEQREHIEDALKHLLD